jgi:hypothetical protein
MKKTDVVMSMSVDGKLSLTVPEIPKDSANALIMCAIASLLCDESKPFGRMLKKVLSEKGIDKILKELKEASE